MNAHITHPNNLSQLIRIAIRNIRMRISIWLWVDFTIIHQIKEKKTTQKKSVRSFIFILFTICGVASLFSQFRIDPHIFCSSFFFGGTANKFSIRILSRWAFYYTVMFISFYHRRARKLLHMTHIVTTAKEKTNSSHHHTTSTSPKRIIFFSSSRFLNLSRFQLNKKKSMPSLYVQWSETKRMGIKIKKNRRHANSHLKLWIVFVFMVLDEYQQ